MNYGRPDLTELGFIRRAIKERWPIKQETRDKLPEIVAHHLLHGDTKAQLAAAKVLLEADKINLQDEQNEMLRQLQAQAESQRELINALTGTSTQVSRGEPASDKRIAGAAEDAGGDGRNGEVESGG